MPRIEGDPRVGLPLTCSRGDWDDPATPYGVTYQWYKGSTVIADATAASYTVQAGDSSLNCRVTAAGLTTSISGSVSLTTSTPGGTPVNTIAPADLRRPSRRQEPDVQPRQLERPGDAVRRHLPLAPRQQRHDRLGRELHHHHRGRRSQPELSGDRRADDDGDQQLDQPDAAGVHPRAGDHR